MGWGAVGWRPSIMRDRGMIPSDFKRKVKVSAMFFAVFFCVAGVGCSTGRKPRHSHKTLLAKIVDVDLRLPDTCGASDNVPFIGPYAQVGRDYTFGVPAEAGRPVPARPIHEVRHDMERFCLRLCGDGACRLTWSRTEPHVASGAYTNVGRWTMEDDTLEVRYCYRPVSIFGVTPASFDGSEMVSTPDEDELNTVCRFAVRIEGNTLIMRLIDVDYSGPDPENISELYDPFS